MSLRERIGLPLLRSMDPERAHGLAIQALRAGLSPVIATPSSPRLATTVAGLSLANPVGLAAGFDKNGTAVAPLLKSGFGFIEIGAVTPRPQPGNPRPRLFRLSADRAVINRFGFNNDGADAVAARLSARQSGDCHDGIVGINLGANKDSDDKAADFAHVLRRIGPHVEFATVNVSSPNTERLRDLQGKDALLGVLDAVMTARASLSRAIPIFLKVAPDLDALQIDDIVAVARQSGLSGIFATNTTLARDGLQSPAREEAGGLSGAPLMAPSTRILAAFAARLDGEIPLIGIGGIASAADAITKIRAGASAVQLYSGLVYGGISLGARIAREMDSLLAADGIADLATIRGSDIARWTG